LIENFPYIGKIVVLFLSMTIKKKIPQENIDNSNEDDYYVLEKQRIAEEAKKAHRIHEEDIQTHLTAMIPYYDDANTEERRLLLLVNSLLIHRFEEVGMVYWWIFRQNPHEIREYADLFWADVTPADMDAMIVFLENKKEESENMVEMGFDEDGEEDPSSSSWWDDEYSENEGNEENEEDEKWREE
jgi:hypothetical protein